MARDGLVMALRWVSVPWTGVDACWSTAPGETFTCMIPYYNALTDADGDDSPWDNPDVVSIRVVDGVVVENAFVALEAMIHAPIHPRDGGVP